MSNVVPNKVDMSLDDIIKLTKFEKRKLAHRGKRGNGAADGISRGRGAAQNRGRGAVQNRGRGAGTGRGGIQNRNPLKQFRTNLQRRGQGRGRGVNRQNPVINQLNPNSTDQQSFRGRGRRRGRGGRGAGIVFTNSRIGLQTSHQLTLGQHQPVQQRERLNKVKEQAALLREKQLAIKNLQQAQKNVQNINMAIQKTSRDNVVNQMRGINTIQTGQPRGRGRRKLAVLKKQGNSNLLNNASPIRQLSNTSVTITNPSAINPAPNVGRKRRRWRRNNINQASSQHFTIQVDNESPSLQPVRNQQSSILNQLKQLKPAVTTTYKFQKSVFAAPATGVSLNDRFSGTSFADADVDIPEGRAVFI